MNFENFTAPKLEKDKKPKISRRKFLGGIATAAGAYVVGQPTLETLEEIAIPETLKKEIEKLQKKLETQFAIQINFSPIEEEYVSNEELSLVEKRDALMGCIEALELYPLAYIRSTKLRKIRLIKKYEEPSPSPTATTAGFVQLEDQGTMNISKEPLWYEAAYYDPESYNFGWTNKGRLKAVFHHEFYHVSDPHLDDDAFNDLWKESNKESGGDPYFEEKSRETLRGFASGYSAAGPVEDRAEIARCLFTDQSALAKPDRALVLKIEFIKKQFYERSNGLMDEFYWKLIKEEDAEEIKKYIEMRERLQGTKKQ